MIIKPVLTEKSLNEAKKGKYTFWVSVDSVKTSLKKEVKTLFGVDVVKVKTINMKGEAKKNFKGRKVQVKPTKKAVFELKEGQKIELFEQEKKGKKQK